MRVRNIVLVLGVLAVLLGAGLAVVWFRQSSSSAPAPAAVVPKVAILVAARLIPIGTLLRAEDINFRDIPQPDLVPSNIPRGPATLTDLLGAVTRRTFQAQDALVAAELVKPGERDFLVATLAPGFRAVSISVDITQSASGLMMPGDHVDVLLTQNFAVPATGDQGLRAVGETVLHDLRIIAIDQVFTDPAAPAEPVAGKSQPEMRVPKTITLEVSVSQAEKLMVANQLGKIQLALRGQRAETPGPAPETVPPTWASDVSPALERLGAAPPAPAAPPPLPGASAKKPSSIEVMHGSKIERLCVSDTGLAACP